MKKTIAILLAAVLIMSLGSAAFADDPHTVTIGSAVNGSATANPISGEAGTTITLTATPDAGYRLKSWTSDPAVSVSGNSFEMPDADVTITPVFERVFSVSVVSPVTGGSATASVSQAAEGEKVTLTPTADAGYRWKEWTVSGGTLSGNELTMPAADVTVTPAFEEIPSFSITVSGDGHGSASVDKNPAKVGETVTLSYTPASGYELNKITIVPAITLSDDNKFTMPEQNVEISVTFKPVETKHSVTVTAGTGGTASASTASAVKGTEVTLTTKAETGYRFKEWTILSGGIKIENNKFTMGEADVSVKAVFEKIPTYKVTLTYTSGGSAYFTANKSTTITVDEGSTVQVSAAASGNGMFIYDVWVNGGQNRVYGSGTTNITYESPAIMKDTVIKVRFGDKYGNPMTGDAGVWQYVAAMLTAFGTGTGIVLSSKKRK